MERIKVGDYIKVRGSTLIFEVSAIRKYVDGNVSILVWSLDGDKSGTVPFESIKNVPVFWDEDDIRFENIDEYVPEAKAEVVENEPRN